MKIFIGYSSMSGNTEDIATILKNVLLLKGAKVRMESLDTVEVESILDFDCLLIGAYTWGDGDIPYEAEDFFSELSQLDLTGISAACFGSGDEFYPKYCGAVDTIADLLSEKGCDVFPQRLKIEHNPETDEQILNCAQFAQSVHDWIFAKKEMQYV